MLFDQSKEYTLKEFVGEIGFDWNITGAEPNEEYVFDNLMEESEEQGNFYVLDISSVSEFANFAIWKKFDYEKGKKFKTEIWYVENESDIQDIIKHY